MKMFFQAFNTIREKIALDSYAIAFNFYSRHAALACNTCCCSIDILYIEIIPKRQRCILYNLHTSLLILFKYHHKFKYIEQREIYVTVERDVTMTKSFTFSCHINADKKTN